MFDAASGFGGYRESGYGREGGLEGLWEYCKPGWLAEAKARAKAAAKASAGAVEPAEAGDEDESSGSDARPFSGASRGIDRTPKMYIGGKQARPDAPYSIAIRSPEGEVVGEVGEEDRPQPGPGPLLHRREPGPPRG